VKVFARLTAVVLGIVALLALGFAANVDLGMRAHARETGTISGLRLRAPVAILRDDRGVPHVLARNEHDMFFAQGYVEGSDRLFQMDLLRRFILGELAEIYGARALATDETERARVFENAPEREQKSDPERKGVAIVIDLARVEGVLKFGPDGPVFVKLG